MPSISVREWIKWESDRSAQEKHTRTLEPTSTLVLTSPGNRFVDIRILREPPLNIGSLACDAAILPFSSLDWAFAGFSSSKLIKDPSKSQLANRTPYHQNNTQITQSTWKHFVDSRHLDAEAVIDTGLMYPQTSTTTLETGSMANPTTGQKETYSEMWRDVQPLLRKDGGLECAVLQLQDDEFQTRGMVVRLGQFCQGVVRQGEKFALERWEMSAEEGWKRSVRMGDLWLPCGGAMQMDQLVLNGKVRFGADEWRVLELSVTDS